MRRSNIGWCDFSGGPLNFVLGCHPLGTGCANCYARRIMALSGRKFEEVLVSTVKLDQVRRGDFSPYDAPFRRGPGSRPIAFPVDMGDLFNGDVPDWFRRAALDVMLQRSDIDWAVLTKRPNRAAMFLYDQKLWLPAHIWLGVSVENTATLSRIDPLATMPVERRFISFEPLLEHISDADLSVALLHHTRRAAHPPRVDWAIIGGESGPGRRPVGLHYSAAAIEHLANFTYTHGIATFVKQDCAARPGQRGALSDWAWSLKGFPA